ncbi:MAG: caspase family protein [Bacteroidia bacterium]|nr:caspase family protein [Bacteroidia bacterium]
MSTRNVYALMVGIDKYLPPVPALDGCVNDMRAMRDFIVRRAQEAGHTLYLEVLENDQATRSNIVAKFDDHLTRAGEQDIVVFYFSGHGAQIPAHEAFWHLEEDKKLETLVCYDSRLSDGMDLADKELATLLDMVAQKKPHILVITDCCNSGTVTRDIGGQTKNRSVTEMPSRVRGLDDFILPRNRSNERSALSISQREALTIPAPRHVAMSAAHSFQLAKETTLGGSPRGVFTFSLLEVLETAVGPLTYNDLLRRVRSLVAQRTYDQVPQLLAEVTEDLNKSFLDGTLLRTAPYIALTFDRQKGWQADAGALHGIPDESLGLEPTLLSVYAEDAPASELNDPGRALGKVRVTDVRASTSTVQPEGGLFMDTSTVYRARIFSLPVSGIRVHVRGDDNTGKQLVLTALTQQPEAVSFIRQADAREADYHLLASKGQYSLIRRADADTQPLVEQIKGFTPETAAKAVQYLLHINRWERVYQLTNPGSALFSEGVRIEIMDPVRDQPMIPASNGFVFRYRKSGGAEARPRFRVRVTNTTGQRLFCSLLYLSSQFEINPDLLFNGGLWLDPGASAWALSARVIQAEVADALYATGRREVRETFKLIAGTQEFDARLMRQPELGLPLPVTRGEAKTNTRALIFGDGSGAGSDDWNTNTMSVSIVRED